jgi:fermentation-respiration switch protein FrsA (DUF1100 family)
VRRGRGAGLLLRRVAAPLLAIIAGLIVLGAAQRRMIYFPFGVPPPPIHAGLPAARPFQFSTEDGLTLSGWFAPAEVPPTGTTVLVFNGNAGHRGMRAPLASALAARGIATALIDYRGYGGNPGAPSEEGLARDARAAVAWLRAQPGVDPQRIAYFGESLGTGVAVRLAAEVPPLALILRSPFTSLVDVGRFHYPWLPVGLLLRDRFPAVEYIRSVLCPVLVIVAAEDTIVPRRSSEALFAAANEPRRLLVLEGVDHNDHELFAGTRMIEAAASLLADAVTPR